MHKLEEFFQPHNCQVPLPSLTTDGHDSMIYLYVSSEPDVSILAVLGIERYLPHHAV